MAKPNLTTREAVPVEANVPLPVDSQPGSWGFIVFLQPSKPDGDALAKKYRDQQIANFKGPVRFHVATVYASGSKTYSVTPDSDGLAYIVDVFGVPSRFELNREFFPGDDQTPGPIIVGGYPPRPRLNFEPIEFGFETRFKLLDVVRLGIEGALANRFSR